MTRGFHGSFTFRERVVGCNTELDRVQALTRQHSTLSLVLTGFLGEMMKNVSCCGDLLCKRLKPSR